MATGQTLLNLVEVLHPELQNQPGEADVTKSLLALNMAQDYMESLLAAEPELMGDGVGNISTTAQIESTAFPANVLRIDKLQYLDPTTLLPVYDLEDLKKAGGHVNNSPWPINLVATSGAQPQAYYTNGTRIYWAPLPDNTYTIRWYGFKTADDITAGGTFAYRDICMNPLATMAARIVRIGLDDAADQLEKLAGDLFKPVITVLSNFRRERAPGYTYRNFHRT